jgi:hypothetical protein
VIDETQDNSKDTSSVWALSLRDYDQIERPQTVELLIYEAQSVAIQVPGAVIPLLQGSRAHIAPNIKGTRIDEGVSFSPS